MQCEKCDESEDLQIFEPNGQLLCPECYDYLEKNWYMVEVDGYGDFWL